MKKTIIITLITIILVISSLTVNAGVTNLRVCPHNGLRNTMGIMFGLPQANCNGQTNPNPQPSYTPAHQPNNLPRPSNFDHMICQDYGFDMAVTKYQWEPAWRKWVQLSIDPNYDTMIKGATSALWWFSTPAIDGIVFQRGNGSFGLASGGEKGDIWNQDPRMLWFCAFQPDDIPEFSTIGAGLAIAGAAYYISRKKLIRRK